LNKDFSKYLNINIRFILSFYIPLILLFSSCSAAPPVKEDKFIKIYVDMLIAQDTTRATGGQLEVVKSEVLKSYSVSEADYDSTLKFYNSDPKRWSDFFDKAIAYLEQLKKQKNS
jgi:Domain of unknown function (DUF4296)